MNYKHSEVFAEVKAIEEDIKINLTSLQYLQILDYYLWNSLYFVIRISPGFITNCLSQILAYQQANTMIKVSSEPREKISNQFFNFLATNDPKHIKLMYLNRGCYFGIISYFLNQSRIYFDSNSPFSESKLDKPNLPIDDLDSYFAHFKQAEYWFNKALDFKSKIMQKYVRFTLLQAQRAYVDFGHRLELDDVTQIYLQIMSKAIDRCDSRFGVLTSFIQNWLKSARAQVQKIIESNQHCDSYDAMIEEFGDSTELGTVDSDHIKDAVEELAYYASIVDTSGCIRLLHNIPQYISLADRQILEEAWESRNI